MPIVPFFGSEVELCGGVGVVFYELNALGPDIVTRIVDGVSAEPAFLQFHDDIALLQKFQYALNVLTFF